MEGLHRPVDHARDAERPFLAIAFRLVVLDNGARGRSVIDLSRQRLSETSGLAGLMEIESSLMQVRGIGRFKAATLLAMREINCRVNRGKITRGKLLNRPGTVASYLMLRYGIADQEVAGALYLDIRNRLIAER